MVKNTPPSTLSQDYHAEAVLSLLAAIVCRNGHSLSWYTSKKGRVWITLVGHSPIRYTTSSECMSSTSDVELLDAMFVMMHHHLPKLMGDAPPLPTWITRKAIDEDKVAAVQFCSAIYTRWKNGEVFWDPTFPAAPLAAPEEFDGEPF